MVGEMKSQRGRIFIDFFCFVYPGIIKCTTQFSLKEMSKTKTEKFLKDDWTEELSLTEYKTDLSLESVMLDKSVNNNNKAPLRNKS